MVWTTITTTVFARKNRGSLVVGRGYSPHSLDTRHTNMESWGTRSQVSPNPNIYWNEPKHHHFSFSFSLVDNRQEEEVEPQTYRREGMVNPLELENKEYGCNSRQYDDDDDDDDEEEFQSILPRPREDQVRLVRPTSTSSSSTWSHCQRLHCLLLMGGILAALIHSFNPISNSMTTIENDDESFIVRASHNNSSNNSGPSSLPTLEENQPPAKNADEEGVKALQKKNFRNGTGLLLNIHITHHGGATFCARVGRALGAASFRCMRPAEGDVDEEEWATIDFQAHNNMTPWSYNDTSSNLATLRKYVRMHSWGLGIKPTRPVRPLSATHWEDPNVVSVLVVRDPISRLLSHNEIIMKQEFEDRQEEEEPPWTKEQWWWFANNSDYTDGYALKWLTDEERPGCCQGEHTRRIHLQLAQRLVQRFTYILDIACLDRGMALLAEELGFDLVLRRGGERDYVHGMSNQERIGHDEIYEYLLKRNQLGIELYEWSKNLSLVRCGDEDTVGKR
jgi:hypothetical protein